MRGRLALVAWVISSSFGYANALDDFAGARISHTDTICYKSNRQKNCVTETGTFLIRENAIEVPGIPTLYFRKIVDQGGFQYSLDANAGSIVLKTQGGSSSPWPGLKTTTTYSLSGSKCSVKSVSNHYTYSNSRCTVSPSQAKRWQAKDAPRACEAVREAIMQITALAPKAGKQGTVRSALNCDKMRKVSRSIKGAGCPSMFPKVNRALAESSHYCAKPVPQLSEVGVRG